MAYNIVSGNQSYDINTLSSGSVTIPYYGGYKDKSNNVTGNISKSTPIDVSIQYVSGSGWLTSSTSVKDTTAASITLNYTSATGERSAKIYLKGAGLTTSNYVTITQKKPSTIAFVWKIGTIHPYNEKTIWVHSSSISIQGVEIENQTYPDDGYVTAKLSSYYIPYSSTTLFTFYFDYSNTYNDYVLSNTTIPILLSVDVDLNVSTIYANTNACKLTNFFNYLNECFQIYNVNNIQLSIHETKPYGQFIVNIDDVKNEVYNGSNPYIPS